MALSVQRKAATEGMLTTNNTNLTNGTGAVWNSAEERVGFVGSDNNSVIGGSVVYSFDSFDSWLSSLLFP
jgi:hypothetical protein